MSALEDIPDDAVRVLDHGYVRLVSCSATDLDVVNAARASFKANQSSVDRRAEGLIAFLMRERHGTPFEHNFFKFEVRAPIFVNREWFRHRIASYNEESGRYSEIHPIFYSPRTRIRTQVGKPGAYTFERIAPVEDERWSKMIEDHNTESYLLYKRMLEAGVAREVARMVLPLTTFSTFIFSCNARALMNFLSLRNAPDAQEEIRMYGAALEIYLGREMPVVYREFIANGRRSP